MPAKGVIQEIIGVVIRAKFPEDEVPAIYNAIEIPLGTVTALFARCSSNSVMAWSKRSQWVLPMVCAEAWR